MENKDKAASKRSLSTYPKHYFEIAARFAKARKRSGLSQAEFAIKLGATASTIKAIEARGVCPNIFLIRQIHKHFGYSYDWIIEGKGE